MTTFSKATIRMPVEVKQAAEALTKMTLVYRVSPGPDDFECHHIESINDALLFLLRHGLADTLRMVNAHIEEQKYVLRGWQEIAKFFMDNPAATDVGTSEFTEGTAGRYVTEMADPRCPRAFSLGEVPVMEAVISRGLRAKAALERALGVPGPTPTPRPKLTLVHSAETGNKPH